MPNANPFINAAVGAPVHLHSPEGMPIPPGHPGAMVAHGHGYPPSMQLTPPHMSHGAYFYAMSGAKKGSASGMEPKGYFDPMYFPAGSVVNSIGGSALANEILQDKKEVGSLSSEELGDGENESEKDKGKDKEGGSNTDSSDTAGGADSGREGNESPPRRSSKQAEGALTGENTGVAPPIEGTMVLRTRSVGYASKVPAAATAPLYTTTRSDPNVRSAPALARSTSEEGDSGQPIPHHLPASPTWSRRTKTTGQIPRAMGDPNATSTPPSSQSPPPQ